MLIINDFFVRYKEAVSNQMEYIKIATSGIVITATRFMQQKPLLRSDIKDSIFVMPPIIYRITSFFLMLLPGHQRVHLFEEEPNFFKQFILNLSKKEVFISMYRKPTSSYAKYLSRYKNLVRVFVELPEHKSVLLNDGISNEKVIITPTPAKIIRKKSKKEYNLNKISILFASWNNGEGDQTKDRGVVYLLDVLQLTPGATLTVIPRDNNLTFFVQEVARRNLESRVFIKSIKNDEELSCVFDDCDFVGFPIQKVLTKDSPNSIIDGISRGKPAIITEIFGLSRIIQENKAGIIIKSGSEAVKLNVSKAEYLKMSKNAFQLSREYTREKYIKAIKKGYDNEHSNC